MITTPGVKLETVSVSGFTDWSMIEISASAEEVVRNAQLTVHSRPGAGWSLFPGEPVTITASGDLVLTGFVRDFSPHHDAETWDGSLAIASKSVDATENSVLDKQKTGFAKNMNAQALSKRFDNNGKGFKALGLKLPIEPPHQITPGASLFNEIERVVRGRGVLIHDQPDGSIVMTDKPEGRHSGGVVLGINILEAGAKFSEAGRHSPVVVRGQSTHGTSAENLRMEAKAEDSGVKRLRPKIIIHEGEATTATIKKRAENEVSRAAGRASSATIIVAGWRDAAGKIWQPNWLVKVEDERIYLNRDMLISSVRLVQTTDDEGSGTYAELSLVDPRALGKSKSKAGKSAAYNAPDAKAKVSVG